MVKCLKWGQATILAGILALLLSACEKNDLYRYQSFAFGTLIEIKIRHQERSVTDHGSASLLSDFDIQHRDWHAWEPGKLTQTSDMLVKAEWFTVDNSLLGLIKLAKKYSLQSKSLFNPTIGKLIQAWGFQGSELPHSPPAENEIEKLLAESPSANDIEIKGDRMRGHNPQLKLDLGAIAKGYAISQAIQKLRDGNIKNALINAGGDLCGIGNQGKRPWRIGIRNPSSEGILASIELDNNECVFTSGDYERYFIYDGKRYHHIIDPRNAHPADKVTSVTVLHHDGALADAASTALFIAGPDGWQEVAKNMGISEVMMIDKKGRIIMTPSMQKRITLEAEYIDRETIIRKP